MSLVIDASIAIAWVVPDEANPSADCAMQQVKEGGAIVPALWSLEVANILAVSERKKRISEQDVKDILEDLKVLPLKIDPETATRAFGETLNLSRKHRLTVYDAAYLELAIRTKLPLASLDRDLLQAAMTEGVKVIH